MVREHAGIYSTRHAAAAAGGGGGGTGWPDRPVGNNGTGSGWQRLHVL